MPLLQPAVHLHLQREKRHPQKPQTLFCMSKTVFSSSKDAIQVTSTIQVYTWIATSQLDRLMLPKLI